MLAWAAPPVEPTPAPRPVAAVPSVLPPSFAQPTPNALDTARMQALQTALSAKPNLEGIALPKAGNTPAGDNNDPEARKKAYSAAIHRITERAYFVPMHTYVTTYGYSKALDFTPYADELPRFYLSKWK